MNQGSTCALVLLCLAIETGLLWFSVNAEAGPQGGGRTCMQKPSCSGVVCRDGNGPLLCCSSPSSDPQTCTGWQAPQQGPTKKSPGFQQCMRGPNCSGVICRDVQGLVLCCPSESSDPQTCVGWHSPTDSTSQKKSALYNCRKGTNCAGLVCQDAHGRLLCCPSGSSDPSACTR